MKFQKLLIIALVLVTNCLYGQENYKPGYVIIDIGDTIFGEIDLQNEYSLSKVCSFRKSSDEMVNDYLPTEIYSYRFTDGPYHISKKFNSKEVFMEFLVESKLNIYNLKYKYEDNYYVEKYEADILHIPFEEKTVYRNDLPYHSKSKTHKTLLKYYLQDAPEIQSEIDNLSTISRTSLIELAEDYHNLVCEDEKCIIYEKKLSRIKLALEPTLGFIYYAIDPLNIRTAEYGVNLYLWMPRSDNRFYLKTGLLRQQFTAEGDQTRVFKTPLQIQYLFPKRKIRPKANFGYNFYHFNFAGIKIPTHTLCAGGGIVYSLVDKISISLSANYEVTPLYGLLMSAGRVEFFAYSYAIGIYFGLY